MMRISMKRTLLLAAACFFVFSLSVEAHADHTEITCKSTPTDFSWEGAQGKYYVAWDRSKTTPGIYLHDYWSEQNYPVLVAEFSRHQGAWIFYNQVPDSLVQTIHRRWENHRSIYRNCVGTQRWRGTQYYYAPHRYHTSHSSHHYSPYRWDKVRRHKPKSVVHVHRSNSHRAHRAHRGHHGQRRYVASGAGKQHHKRKHHKRRHHKRKHHRRH